MQALFTKLWRDDVGFVVTTELVLIATIVVIGLITGLTTIRDQVTTELADVADAISELDQSYSWSAITAHASSVAGSVFNDAPDFCDQKTGIGAQGITAAGATCVDLGVTVTGE